MKLFVGSLPYEVDDMALKELFGDFEVLTAKVVYDRDSGRSRGFGFVEIRSPDKAKEAIQALDGASVRGRYLSVKEAEDRRPVLNPSRFETNRTPKPEMNRGPQVVYKGRSAAPAAPPPNSRKKNKPRRGKDWDYEDNY